MRLSSCTLLLAPLLAGACGDSGTKPTDAAASDGPGSDAATQEGGSPNDGAPDTGGAGIPLTKVARLTGCAVKYERKAFPAVGPGGFSPSGGEPAQSFSLPGGTTQVTNIVGFFASKPGPTGKVVIEIRDDSGFGSPDALVHASVAVAGSMLPTTPAGESGEYYKVAFASPIALKAGPPYWILVRNETSLDIMSKFQWYYDTPASGAMGTGIKSTKFGPLETVNFEFGVNCP